MSWGKSLCDWDWTGGRRRLRNWCWWSLESLNTVQQASSGMQWTIVLHERFPPDPLTFAESCDMIWCSLQNSPRKLCQRFCACEASSLRLQLMLRFSWLEWLWNGEQKSFLLEWVRLSSDCGWGSRMFLNTSSYLRDLKIVTRFVWFESNLYFKLKLG